MNTLEQELTPEISVGIGSFVAHNVGFDDVSLPERRIIVTLEHLGALIDHWRHYLKAIGRRKICHQFFFCIIEASFFNPLTPSWPCSLLQSY